MPKPAATRHVVERCPRCGVEHDVSADSLCEACDTQLRYWCRVHGRETGWLDAPSCASCSREALRRRLDSAPRRAPESIPRPAAAASAGLPPAAAAAVAAPTPAPPPAPGLGVLLRPPDRVTHPVAAAATGSMSGSTVLRTTILVLAGSAAGGLLLGWLSVATADERVWTAAVAVGLIRAFLYVRRRRPWIGR